MPGRLESGPPAGHPVSVGPPRSLRADSERNGAAAAGAARGACADPAPPGAGAASGPLSLSRPVARFESAAGSFPRPGRLDGSGVLLRQAARHTCARCCGSCPVCPLRQHPRGSPPHVGRRLVRRRRPLPARPLVGPTGHGRDSPARPGVGGARCERSECAPLQRCGGGARALRRPARRVLKSAASESPSQLAAILGSAELNSARLEEWGYPLCRDGGQQPTKEYPLGRRWPVSDGREVSTMTDIFGQLKSTSWTAFRTIHPKP